MSFSPRGEMYFLLWKGQRKNRFFRKSRIERYKCENPHNRTNLTCFTEMTGNRIGKAGITRTFGLFYVFCLFCTQNGKRHKEKNGNLSPLT